MLRHVFLTKGRPSGVTYLFAATLASAAVVGYINGPRISADIERQRVAQKMWEQSRPAPTPRQLAACELDWKPSPWCLMGRYVIPN